MAVLSHGITIAILTIAICLFIGCNGDISLKNAAQTDLENVTPFEETSKDIFQSNDLESVDQPDTPLWTASETSYDLTEPNDPALLGALIRVRRKGGKGGGKGESGGRGRSFGRSRGRGFGGRGRGYGRYGRYGGYGRRNYGRYSGYGRRNYGGYYGRYNYRRSYNNYNRYNYFG